MQERWSGYVARINVMVDELGVRLFEGAYLLALFIGYTWRGTAVLVLLMNFKNEKNGRVVFPYIIPTA